MKRATEPTRLEYYVQFGPEPHSALTEQVDLNDRDDILRRLAELNRISHRYEAPDRRFGGAVLAALNVVNDDRRRLLNRLEDLGDRP